MALSDAQINRLCIRQWWNRAMGPGGPWGQTVTFPGQDPCDLGGFYEWCAAADPEHGLENVYIDIQANHNGDAVSQHAIQLGDKFFYVDPVAEQAAIAAIKAKVGA
jgi:hypothetical protein